MTAPPPTTAHPHSRIWGHPEHIKVVKAAKAVAEAKMARNIEHAKHMAGHNEPWDPGHLFFYILLAFLVLLLVFHCMRRSYRARGSKWPFKVLQRSGKFITGAIPTNGKGFDSRKRDFARMATGGRNVLFCTPNDTPQVWKSEQKPDGVFTQDIVDGVYRELQQWLEYEVRVSGKTEITPGLVERVVGLLAVGEPYFWTRKFKIPNVFLQPKYVLIVSSVGEVRVAWYAYITDKIVPNMESGPYIVKFISKDLNEPGAQHFATTKLYYSVRSAKETDMLKVVESHVPAITRAAVENNWNDFFQS